MVFKSITPIIPLYSRGPSVKVLFEDDSVLALEKPSGIPTVPGCSPEISLKESLETLKGKVFVVHRLDKLTSGVVLFAKEPASHKYLCSLFESRRAKKEYVCLVSGNTEEEFFVSLPIRQFGSGRMGYDPNGKESETRFCKIAEGRYYTLLKAFPITGRRHQIRVHLYLRGFPVLGDPLYGSQNIRGRYRLMLHAHRLTYVNPSGNLIEICSAIPEEFFHVLQEGDED